jgi:hypothetical protein
LPSRREADAIAQFQRISSVQHGVNCADAGDIDDPAAVDAAKFSRIELVLHGGEGFAQQMRFRAAMQLRVIVGRFNPSDGLDGDEFIFVRVSYDKAIGPRAIQIHQGLQLLSERGLMVRRVPLAGALDAASQSLLVEWLPQIVDSIHLEGLDRVFILGRDKNDHGHALRADLPHDVQAVQSGIPAWPKWLFSIVLIFVPTLGFYKHRVLVLERSSCPEQNDPETLWRLQREASHARK